MCLICFNLFCHVSLAYRIKIVWVKVWIKVRIRFLVLALILGRMTGRGESSRLATAFG